MLLAAGVPVDQVQIHTPLDRIPHKHFLAYFSVRKQPLAAMWVCRYHLVCNEDGGGYRAADHHLTALGNGEMGFVRPARRAITHSQTCAVSMSRMRTTASLSAPLRRTPRGEFQGMFVSGIQHHSCCRFVWCDHAAKKRLVRRDVGRRAVPLCCHT
jgi:hypothetical protein